MEAKAKTSKSSEMFSMRLEADQRALIDEAAALTGSSVGRFIRDAAISRAVEALNASGEREVQLRELARKVVGHLFHVKAVAKGKDKEPCVESELWNPELVQDWDDANDCPTPEKVWSSQMIMGAQNALRAAFENAGSEFIRLMIEEWDGWGQEALEYAPRFSIKEALSKGGGVDMDETKNEEGKQNE